MRSIRSVVLALCAIASLSALAVGKGTDDKGEYWEDEAGVKN